jgi:hypothetical protein
VNGAYFIGVGRKEFVGTVRIKAYYVGHCIILEF